MADPEQKALDLMAQAEKKMKSMGGFFGRFGGSSKVDEAAELYVKAGNNFKMAKKWSAGADAFCKAASVYMRMDHKHEAASHYVEAANCFKKTDPNEAVKCLMKGIEIFTDMGRFTVAAKHHITVAEIYETEIVDLKKAITNYEQAGDYYKGEESSSSANKCMLKVAQYSAQLEQYEKAIAIYEQVAQSSMDNQLLRYSAKDHFFRAALCRMCVDLQDTANSITKYEEMFPTLSDTREIKLLKSLLTACEDQNAEEYADAVRDFDSISRLDQWCTTILLRIKKSIEGESALR